MSELMTPLEVSALLKVKPRTLEDWRQGRSGPSLPFIRLGNRVRYRADDVRALIDTSVVSRAVAA